MTNSSKLKIELDYENSAELSWTLTAKNTLERTIAAVCSTNLEEAQLKLSLLLIEFGYDIYEKTTEVDGFVIY